MLANNQTPSRLLSMETTFLTAEAGAANNAARAFLTAIAEKALAVDGAHHVRVIDVAGSSGHNVHAALNAFGEPLALAEIQWELASASLPPGNYGEAVIAAHTALVEALWHEVDTYLTMAGRTYPVRAEVKVGDEWVALPL